MFLNCERLRFFSDFVCPSYILLNTLHVNNVWSMSVPLSSFFLSGHLNKPQFRTPKLEIGLTSILMERVAPHGCGSAWV